MIGYIAHKTPSLATIDGRMARASERFIGLRKDLGLDRAHAMVGAVGSTFELGHGMNPRNIAP